MSEANARADALAQAVLAGERRALARAITLCESERPEDGEACERLLHELLPRSGGALRLGVTGPPGAGKSTLIDALGRSLIAAGGRVAVLAVDPSSQLSGGSILADKTRMSRLAAEDRSFIRPSPAGAAAGGVTRHTREAILLCEAAGYGTVIVETVGVGQSELGVASVVDLVLLVLQPGAGDELQGMKRGILEVTDLVAVNKADGPDRERAERAAGELRAALSLFTRALGGSAPEVLTASALAEGGGAELARALTELGEQRRASGALAGRRRAGLRAWFREELDAALGRRLRAGDAAQRLAELEGEVERGALTARRAAQRFLASGV